MSKLELNQIYLELELQIKRLNQSTLVVYKDAIRKDAQQVISILKEDIDMWVIQLNERKIACYDLETLLEAKRDKIKLYQLENKGVDAEELELFKSDILRLIARAITNTYLESLFRNRNEHLHDKVNFFER